MVYRIVLDGLRKFIVNGGIDQARKAALSASKKFGRDVELDFAEPGEHWTEVEFICPGGSEISTLKSPIVAPSDFGLINREPFFDSKNQSQAVFSFKQGRAVQNPMFFV